MSKSHRIHRVPRGFSPLAVLCLAAAFSLSGAIAAGAPAGSAAKASSAPGSAAKATSTPSGAFDQLVDDFVLGTLALSPSTATAQGYHEHKGVSLDDALDDYSAAGLDAVRTLDGSIEARIAKLDAGSLNAEQRTDIDIMKDALAESRLELDEIQGYRHNPTLYVEMLGNALYSPYVLHYAPPAARFRHIIARLNKLPETVRQAEANLTDAPQVWNEVAREENQGNIRLIDVTLRAECPSELRMRYDQAAAAALDSLKGFNRWLEDHLAERRSDWRLGKERYAKKFRNTLEIAKTPEALLAEAEAALTQTRAEMARLAAPKTVEQALADVASHHATVDTYMDSARKALAQATAFVKAKNLLTLPPNANLEVIPTPEFMRGTYSVGGFNPAPALEPKLGAFFWLTPIPSSWPQARIDSKLREYNDSTMQHLTVHEAMPGHYVQAEYANAVEPRSRRLLRSIDGNGAYVEGWAIYTQKLLSEQGYLNDTPGYELSFRKQLLRTIANTILDIRLQTLNMSDREAMDLMVKSTYQESEEATEKLQRAKLSSCQLPTYFAGLQGWLEAREHFRARHGAAPDLKQFHERALEEGAVPLSALDRLLQ